MKLSKPFRNGFTTLFVLVSTIFIFSVCCGEEWNPEKTHVLFVGVLEWEDKDLTPYPKENRQDRALERQLIECGVPEGNIVFLEDQEATKARIASELKKIAKKSYDTFIFYYAGHGVRNGNEIYFANYDIDGMNVASTGFSLSELGHILKFHWYGKRLFLFADCYHSGGLSSVVEQFEGDDAVYAASITSVVASNVSTERWTFTESLVKVYAGDWLVDMDRDCTITFADVDAFIQQEMRYRECQFTYAVKTENFSDDFVFGKATACGLKDESDSPWRISQYVECEWKGQWWLAQIIDIQKGKWKIHYLNYDDSWDEWVDASRLRKPVGIGVKVGEKVEVEWGGKWWKADVLKVEKDFAFIHYEGYGSEWDEWVTKERIRE
jgi:hypothetical protein